MMAYVTVVENVVSLYKVCFRMVEPLSFVCWQDIFDHGTV
jgi:hypothetical protein